MTGGPTLPASPLSPAGAPIPDVSVLAAHGDPAELERLREIVSAATGGVHVAGDGREALLASARLRPDLLVADLDLPRVDGPSLARAARSMLPSLCVLLLVDPDDPAALRRAAAAPYARWLPKPVDPAALLEAVSEMSREALARRDLERRRDLAETMLRSLPNPAMLLDRVDRRAVLVNRAAEELGFRPGEVCGGPFFMEEADAPDEARGAWASGDAAAAPVPHGQPGHSGRALGFGDCLAYYEVRRREVSAHGRVWDVAVAPMTGGTLLFSATDVTTRKAAEATLRNAQAELERRVDERTEELRRKNEELTREVDLRRRVERQLTRAKEAAEAADKAKSSFLANMSHEIRTPMNAILGFTGLVLDSELTEEQRGSLEFVKASSQTLLDIINDILDFSRIEAGRMELSSQRFEPRAVLSEAVRLFALHARRKGLALRWHVDDDVPAALVGDPVRFKQILINLAGNAVKFTDVGEVEVRVGLAEPAARTEDCELCVSVRDTAQGMPPDKLAVIFDSFTQLDDSQTKAYQGTGLGLAISKRLVELMKGRIWVESEVGKGSTFHFTVRFETCQAGREEAFFREAACGGPSLRVLLVDDHQISRVLSARFLERAGHRPMEAASGLEALELLRRERFDCVLMDVQMPHMDGVETVRRIKNGEAGEAGRRTPVIAATAYALKGDRERLLGEGMDDYLPKPFDFASLLEVLERVADRERQATDAA